MQRSAAARDPIYSTVSAHDLAVGQALTYEFLTSSAVNVCVTKTTIDTRPHQRKDCALAQSTHGSLFKGQ